MKKNTEWLNFLSGGNSLLINNEKEFEKFSKFLDYLGLKSFLLNYNTYSEWQHLAKINNRESDYIIFECSPSKGITFGYTKESSLDWYGEEPYNVDIIDNFFENLNLSNKELEEIIK